MAKKLTSDQVNAILAKAAKAKTYDFILEVVSDDTEPKRFYSEMYHARLKGKNGEISMHQELVIKKFNAEYLCARLINSGLRAKYVFRKIK